MRNIAVYPDAPGAIRIAEAPDPGTPSGWDVRIRMLRAPINPADLLAIDRRYTVVLSDAVPLGAEGVAAVEALGENVADLRPGDLVLPLDRGNWCTCRTVPRARLIVVPSGLTVEQAAMLRINPATAWLLLAAAGVGPGDVIVQNGAGSAVAAWVRRFASARGVSVLDVVRRETPDLPRSLVDGRDLAERVFASTRGARISAALDCVSGDATGRLAACVGAEGRILVFGHLSGMPVTVPSGVLTAKGLSVVGFSLRPVEAKLGPDCVARMFADIFEHAAIMPAARVGAVVPITEAGDAVALARRGGAGRVQLAFETMISGM